MTNIAGLAIIVTATASGYCVVDHPHVTGSRLKPGAIDSFVYVDRASALQRVDVRHGMFARGPDRLAISLMPGRLRLTDNMTR